jgi:hypothetical protein
MLVFFFARRRSLRIAAFLSAPLVVVKWEAVELYDLHADPSEAVNQHGNASYAAALAALVHFWQRDWPGTRSSLAMETSLLVVSDTSR